MPSVCSHCKKNPSQFHCGNGCGIRYCSKECAAVFWNDREHHMSCIGVTVSGRKRLRELGGNTLVILKTPEKTEITLTFDLARKSQTLANVIDDAEDNPDETLVIELPTISPTTLFMLRDLLTNEEAFIAGMDKNLSFGDLVRLINACNYLDVQSVLQNPAFFNGWKRVFSNSDFLNSEMEIRNVDFEKLFPPDRDIVFTPFDYASIMNQLEQFDTSPLPTPFYGNVNSHQIPADVWKLGLLYIDNGVQFKLALLNPRLFKIIYQYRASLTDSNIAIIFVDANTRFNIFCMTAAFKELVIKLL
jgi:hypothetical protein